MLAGGGGDGSQSSDQELALSRAVDAMALSTLSMDKDLESSQSKKESIVKVGKWMPGETKHWSNRWAFGKSAEEIKPLERSAKKCFSTRKNGNFNASIYEKVFKVYCHDHAYPTYITVYPFKVQ